MQQVRKKSGFTLIELLVVIVILGILSTISVGTFRSYFSNARDTERVSTVQNIAMMIKVDSGGEGDCGVYNYQGMSGQTWDAANEVEVGTCNKMGVLDTLLADNDYKMPNIKNGLEYNYGFILGETEGDNDFFVAIGAEEENATNGQVVIGAESVFIDGTGIGIDEGMGCIWASGDVTCANPEISLYKLDSDGAPSTEIVYSAEPCSTYSAGTKVQCEAAGCGWSGGCPNAAALTQEACEAQTPPENWTGSCMEL